jgi:hypothetical protein
VVAKTSGQHQTAVAAVPVSNQTSLTDNFMECILRGPDHARGEGRIFLQRGLILENILKGSRNISLLERN